MAEEISLDSRLKHIAIIMDGNGRWAQNRLMPREYGHKIGAKALEDLGTYCKKIGLSYLTVYAFSTENWKRPEKEVSAIMKAVDEYIIKSTADCEKNQVSFRFLGDLTRFSQETQQNIHHLEEISKGYSFHLSIALNYGGREEIVHACNQLLKEGKTEITESDISANIYSHDIPDPDLIIRTGGELRISNFLLWQNAYSEFYFTNVLWPDFDSKELDKAINDFYHRKRRYGGV